MNKLLAASFSTWMLAAASVNAEEPKTVPSGASVRITVTPGQAPAPDVSILLLKRTGHVTPCRVNCTHTGGGNIDVQQPSPDTLVVTMSGAAVAYGTPLTTASAGMKFDLTQCFEVSFDKPSVKAAKLTIEGRVIGLLRSSCKGTAEESGGASITVAGGPVAVLSMPGRHVSNGENLSVNDREGPVSAIVTAGNFTLEQSFSVQADMGRTVIGKAPSVEFAPDPAIDPIWLGLKEPFHGAAKKDFGFRIIVKVAPSDEKPEEKKTEEAAPPQKIGQFGGAAAPAPFVNAPRPPR